MVNIIRAIVEAWHRFRHHKTLKKAIKHANHVRYTTGYKCFVICTPKGYKAYSKQALKQLVKQRYFKKGVTVQHLEKMAVYVTK